MFNLTVGRFVLNHIPATISEVILGREDHLIRQSALHFFGINFGRLSEESGVTLYGIT